MTKTILLNPKDVKNKRITTQKYILFNEDEYKNLIDNKNILSKHLNPKIE